MACNLDKVFPQVYIAPTSTHEESMKASDYIADFLAKRDVTHVFEVIGGAAVHLVHSIADHPDIDYIAVQHEQGGAMAAEAYARMTKNIGVAMATSGPGMTNLITGIGCAYFDSTPILCITGQVNTFESKQGRNVRQIGFQETDIADIVRPLTKYSVRVEKAGNLRYELEKAFHIATSGRPGPVLVDVPLDIQRQDVKPTKLKSFKPSSYKLKLNTALQVKRKVSQTMKLLAKAERPVVIAGGGVRYADQLKQFETLVDTLSIPVVATWSGIDLLPHSHELYRGQIGVYGNRAANFVIQNSDCILSVGSRLDTRITGGKPETFARAAKKIIIDIDRDELYKKRGLEPDVGIVADVRDVVPLLTKEAKNVAFSDIKDWKQLTQEWMSEYPSVLPKWHNRKKLVDPYVFIEALSNQLPRNYVTITDCGANLTWTIQAFSVKRGQRLISAMGNSPMGYSFPASLGASVALGKKPVVCIIGDGGFQINIQELQTMAHYTLPVKVFILNNHSYGIILQFQKENFNGRYVGTLPATGYSMPDFVKLAGVYGIATERITNHSELDRKIKKVLSHRGPIICDVHIPVHHRLKPKVSFGNPIEDLGPKLPDDEFRKHMLIPVISR